MEQLNFLANAKARSDQDIIYLKKMEGKDVICVSINKIKHNSSRGSRNSNNKMISRLKIDEGVNTPVTKWTKQTLVIKTTRYTQCT